jgi:hypothetical protein
MYDVLDFYLVANPIDRYSIGDRTPELGTAEDGSVTILMQTDSPGPDKESNCLPTPQGEVPSDPAYVPAAESDPGWNLPGLG